MKDSKLSLFVYRVWWAWKGDNPDPDTVAFMNKNYPPDWTYADFAAQFHAELYGWYRTIYSLFVIYYCF